MNFRIYCRPDKFDGTESILYHNEGARSRFNDYDKDGFANVFVANDGRPDLIVTDLATELYAIYRNEGNGLFRYSTLPTGLNQNPTDSVGRRWASG